MEPATTAPWRRYGLLLGVLVLVVGLVVAGLGFLQWQSARTDVESGCFNAPGQGIDQGCRARALESADTARSLMLASAAGAAAGVALVGLSLYLPRSWG